MLWLIRMTGRPGALEWTVYHGLVRTREFTVHENGDDGDSAWVTLRCDALAAGREPGYPYAVVVEVTCRLRAAALGVDAPDRLHLDVPARVAIATGPDLLPGPAGAAYVPLAGHVRREPIGDAVVDGAFVSSPDATGDIRSVLSDPVTGLRLAVRQERGLIHVFTGDTVARDRRASVAIEPVEVMTDALNRPDCAGAIRLEPGGHRSFRFGVELDWTAQVVSKT